MTAKIFSHNPLLAGIISIIFGSLLIYFRNELINILLMISGGLLIVLAIIKFIEFLKDNSDVDNKWSFLPFSVIFMSILGFLFIVSPAFWVALSEIIIAVIVLILALGKIMLLTQLKSNGVKISYIYYLVPSILFIFCILAIINPGYVLGSITAAFGALIVLFGLSELVDYIIIRNDRLRKKFGSISLNEENGSYIDAVEIKENESKDC